MGPTADGMTDGMFYWVYIPRLALYLVDLGRRPKTR